jgi:hypothetical protein
MVRRDRTVERIARVKSKAVRSCTSLAGESPVRIGAGASGSRVQSRGESIATERTVESLIGGSNEAGRNTVNAEQASSDYQPKGAWEGRAGHVAAKAMHSAFVPEQALGFSGVWAAACFEREVRNTRDPSRWPTSGKDRAYKAGAESAGSRAGVRGADSTVEGADKALEGSGPALVAPVAQVSARACP